jgi:hypothetical protein
MAIHKNKIYISPNLVIIDSIKEKLPEGIIKKYFENTDMDFNPALISFSIRFPEE